MCGGLEPAVPSDCMWPKESAAMLLVQQHGQRGRVALRKCSPTALDGRLSPPDRQRASKR